MEGIFTIKIPYESRSSYFDIIFKINKLVDIDGISALFVNNNPYNLEAYFVVETVHYAEKINEIIKAHDLKVNNEKGFNEFMKDITLKKWNIAILSKNMDKLEIENTISRRFIFAEKDELIKDGMGDSGFIRKKVFISYCHVNKDIIYDVCDHLEVLGVNMWLDKKAIDIGENIQRRILEGIQESDIAILFLSNATKKSNFAQHELENIMAARTKKDKNWYLVKVDDVNLDDILYGLSNYKYYDFQNNSSIEELAEDIKRYIDSTDI